MARCQCCMASRGVGGECMIGGECRGQQAVSPGLGLFAGHLCVLVNLRKHLISELISSSCLLTTSSYLSTSVSRQLTSVPIY